MISQLVGAFIRAILVALLVATPSLVLPGVGSGAQEIAMVIGLVMAAITLFEYGSSHPGLVEFRFAPPFNRIRFVSLFLTVLLLAIMCRGQLHTSEASVFVGRIGIVVGQAMDFPFSPVRAVTNLLSSGGSTADRELIRSAAGLSYFVSLTSLAIFVIVLNAFRWPLGHGNFNIWVNLPMFDPASGNNVEERLTRDARINVVFGFTLPFLVPLIAAYSTGLYELESLQSHQTLIWMVALWAFLPASMFMRGIAMGKLARMIRRKRDRLHQAGRNEFSPV